MPTRRTVLQAGMAASLGLLGATAAPKKAQALTRFYSPPMLPYRDQLPIPPAMSASTALVAEQVGHRFHRDYPVNQMWGYNGRYGGPTLTAQQGVATNLVFENRLGRHVLDDNVDITMHMMSEEDITAPRTNLHLHGHLSRPEMDGHALANFRPGAVARYRYENRDSARQLWFHDHAMAMTRLNVAAGLFGNYLVRDQFDTGDASNTLGLPSGEAEIPLTIADRMFDWTGQMMYRFTPLQPANRWSGTWVGDRNIVNGKVWPELTVSRGVYRFRLLNAASARVYKLTVGNAVPMYVIGTDGGLLNKPVRVSSLVISPSERYDVLIDFTNAMPGQLIWLTNLEPAPTVNGVLLMGPVPQVMQFRVGWGQGAVRSVPASLRGGPSQSAVLPPPVMTGHRRIVTTALQVDLPTGFPPIRMLLNNKPFMTPDPDVVKTGSWEIWDIVNPLPLDHPIHLHMVASMRVISRRPLDAVGYLASNPVPAEGIAWAPDPDRFVGWASGPEPYEVGDKDTVLSRGLTVTRVAVKWPSLDDLGFDPDARFHPGEILDDPSKAASLMSSPWLMEVGHAGDHLQGYVWHCHILDHEDHDMMQPLRLMT